MKVNKYKIASSILTLLICILLIYNIKFYMALIIVILMGITDAIAYIDGYTKGKGE